MSQPVDPNHVQLATVDRACSSVSTEVTAAVPAQTANHSAPTSTTNNNNNKKPKIDLYIDAPVSKSDLAALSHETGLKLGYHKRVKCPGACPHPRLRAARAVYEHWMCNEFRGKKILDVGGNASRHRRIRRGKVYTLAPILSVEDAMRQRSPVAGESCNCTLRQFVDGSCDHCNMDIAGSISVHSLYYLDPMELAQLCEEGDHLALIHDVSSPYGEIGEAWYASMDGMVEFDAGEAARYYHGTMEWMAAGCHRYTRKQQLVWHRVADFEYGQVYRFKLVSARLKRGGTYVQAKAKVRSINSHRLGSRQGKLIKFGDVTVKSKHVDMIALRMAQVHGAANLEQRALGWLREEIPDGVDGFTYCVNVIKLAQATLPGNIAALRETQEQVNEVQDTLDELWNLEPPEEEEGPFWVWVIGLLVALFAVILGFLLLI